MALAACSGDSEPTVDSALTPIRFAASIDEAKMTRADGSLIEGNGFSSGSIGVYAFSTSGLLTANGTSNMNNEPLSLNNTSLNYVTGRYWPSDEVSVFAYYPYNATGLTINGSGNLPTSFTFNMQQSSGSQIDLLVSKYTTATLSRAANGSQSPLYGTVPLVFHHALSQIRFYVLLDIAKDGIWWDTSGNQPISFQADITLSGLYTSGTLNISTSPSSNEWGGHSWDSQSGSGSSVANNVSWTPVVAKTFNSSTFNPNDYTIGNAEKMLMIPATYTTLPTMTIVIHDTRTGIAEGDRNGAATLSTTLVANDSGNLTWKPGYIYNYFFVIELGKTVKGYFLNPLLEAEQW